MIKLVLLLKPRSSKRVEKSMVRFVELHLDKFLARHGMRIVSYEVREC